MMEKFCLKDDKGWVIFEAEITDKSEFHIDVTVYSVLSWDQDMVPLETEVYLTAYMKWDGCCHVSFGEEGYIHICGVHAWKEHTQMMEWLYKLAETNIEKFWVDEKWQ